MTRLADFMDNCATLADAAQPIGLSGRLSKVTGMVVEASGLQLPVGSLCLLHSVGAPKVEAEVVGFGAGRLLLMPASDTAGLAQNTLVAPHEPQVPRPRLGQPAHPWRRATDRARHLPIGDGLLGRVIDADGTPLDGLGALGRTSPAPIRGRSINAMDREPVRTPLDTGVRAINALLTVGRGQRLGLFAGAGIGKSVLLGMMARYTGADVIVVGLVGERGREIKEFVEDILGEDGRRRSVVVAAPSDTPPIARLQGANYATAIAEHFRDQGKHVLLLMDSLTRYAMAAREVALAIGEAPATKGYPPSVFARLPALIERTGNGVKGVGSITAFYTVLAEGDDQQDPIADAARSFLDGHIVLSRSLADAGHYPAIDIEQSISRVMSAITPDRSPAGRAAVEGPLVALPAQPRADHHRRLCPRKRCADGPRHPADAADRTVPAPGNLRTQHAGAGPGLARAAARRRRRGAAGGRPVTRQPLRLVIEHYRRLRDDAVAAQARVQQELNAARLTLSTLAGYRDEQLQRARESQRNPLSNVHLLLQTRFSGKLEEAIALQTQRVDDIRQRIEACRVQVLHHQQRLKAIEFIDAQRLSRARTKAARAEQFASDERAADTHAQDARHIGDMSVAGPYPLP